MQPSDPSQQWQPGYPYQGQPPGAPQSGPPSGPMYPASGVPYPTQPSAPPYQQPAVPQYPQYPAQPYGQQSAPPYGQQSAPPYGQPSAPPPPTPPRRGSWPVVLIAGIGALAVMAIAIVAVIAFRSSKDKPVTQPTANPPASGASGGPNGGFDQCLVGQWQETDYQHNVDLSDTEVGKSQKLGKIKFTGSGLKWTINADGTAVEDDSDVVYTGSTTDKHTVTAKGEGTVNWKLSIQDRKIYFAGISGTSAITIAIDGADKGRIEFQPNQDPIPYTCVGDVWRTTSDKDTSNFSTFDRVK